MAPADDDTAHMKRNHNGLVAASIICFFVACSSALEPDPFPSVELRTEVTPTIVELGDTVTIRAIMRNTSGSVVDVGRGCGPPVLFELRDLGSVVYPDRRDATFTCEGRDYHVLEPFETDTVVWRWRVAVGRGSWWVRTGFRNILTLERLTPAVVLTVQ